MILPTSEARDTYSWQLYRKDSCLLSDEELHGRILAVHRDGFARPEGWSIKGIREDLERSTVVWLLSSLNSHDLGGYAFHVVPDERLDESWLLWEEAICLRKSLQGRGLSTQALRKTSSLFPDRELRWLGGRTQNPIVLKRYLRHAAFVLPINAGYDGEDGKPIMSFLRRYIAQVRESDSMDTRTGICYAAYKERLGDYKVDLSDPKVAMIERKLGELAFDRDKGDAVIAVAKLKEALPKDVLLPSLGA